MIKKKYIVPMVIFLVVLGIYRERTRLDYDFDDLGIYMDIEDERVVLPYYFSFTRDFVHGSFTVLQHVADGLVRVLGRQHNYYVCFENHEDALPLVASFNREYRYMHGYRYYFSSDFATKSQQEFLQNFPLKSYVGDFRAKITKTSNCENFDKIRSVYDFTVKNTYIWHESNTVSVGEDVLQQ